MVRAASKDGPFVGCSESGHDVRPRPNSNEQALSGLNGFFFGPINILSIIVIFMLSGSAFGNRAARSPLLDLCEPAGVPMSKAIH